MLPLAFADVGKDYVVKGVGGNPETKKHLESMGFVVGSIVSVINTMNGNLIVKVKESRVAVSKEMSQKIMV